MIDVKNMISFRSRSGKEFENISKNDPITYAIVKADIYAGLYSFSIILLPKRFEEVSTLMSLYIKLKYKKDIKLVFHNKNTIEIMAFNETGVIHNIVDMFILRRKLPGNTYSSNIFAIDKCKKK